MLGFGSMDDRKVKDKPQGVAAPTFEDEGDESKLERSDVRKGHANEVATVAENQEVADGDRGTHGEVNENDKRMQETGTLGSTFSDKKTSSRISEGKKARAGMDTVNQDDGESNDKKISNDPQLDDPSEFLEKLESVFSHFGDYILAIMLKNLKLRLRQGNIAETYQKRIEELTIENGGNSTEAAQTLERQITDIFGKSFQVKMDRYLKLLVDHVKLP